MVESDFEFAFIRPDNEIIELRMEFNNNIFSGMFDRSRKHIEMSLKDLSGELTEFLPGDKDDLRRFYEYFTEQLAKFYFLKKHTKSAKIR